MVKRAHSSQADPFLLPRPRQGWIVRISRPDRGGVQGREFFTALLAASDPPCQCQCAFQSIWSVAALTEFNGTPQDHQPAAPARALREKAWTVGSQPNASSWSVAKLRLLMIPLSRPVGQPAPWTRSSKCEY